MPQPDFSKQLRFTEQIAKTIDPLARARSAQAMLSETQALTNRLIEIRRRAVAEASRQPGITYQLIADQLGISVAMVGRLVSETLRDMLPGGPDDIHRLIEDARGPIEPGARFK